MNKRFYYVRSLLPVLFTLLGLNMHGTGNPMLFTGSIQFPSHIKEVPQMFLYSLGSRVQGTPDSPSHKFTYTISRPRGIERFWLVITQNLSCTQAEQNTLKSWKVDITKPYKFYSLTRVLDEEAIEQDGGETRPRFRWEVISHKLSEQDGLLPDDVVIVYYDPALIADIRGGSPFEWPTIIVRNDALSILGSEAALHDVSTRLSIAAMDLRPFFSPIEYEIRQDARVKTIIALTTT